jgi:hypothetical protein
MIALPFFLELDQEGVPGQSWGQEEDVTMPVRVSHLRKDRGRSHGDGQGRNHGLCGEPH